METLWICDIGGTNCRLAEFQVSEDSECSLTGEYWAKTEDITREDALLACLKEHFGEKASLAGLGIAIAGPVRGDTARLTNHALEIHRASLQKAFPHTRIVLLNDFVAQAYACLSPKAEKARPLRGNGEKRAGNYGIVGAGTGLGCAALLSAPHGYVALASEAGHAPFPFQPDEAGFAREFEKTKRGAYPSCEEVLQGRGLERLHRYLTGNALSCAEIAREALRDNTPTLHWYATFYGRFCQMWLLTTLPRAGLYLSGGIAIKNPSIVTSTAFLEAVNAPSAQDWISDIPLYLFDEASIGLWGACAATLHKIRSDS